MNRAHWSLPLAVAVVCGATACGDATGPPAPADPYVLSSRGVRLFGETRIPVVLARFANGPTSPWTPAQLGARLFGGADGGLVNGPFRASSDGRFRLRADLSPWVVTGAASNQGNSGPFVQEAVQAADAELDFAQYDNDGPDLLPNSGDDDGFVDGGVVVLHSSLDRLCSSASTDPNAGPHPITNNVWRIGDPPAPFQTNDSARGGGFIQIRAYTILSATDCSRTATNSTVLSHELGHLLLGLPDLYDQLALTPVPANELWRGRRWVVGCWDLMAAGSWGCGSGVPPRPVETSVGLSAWGRSFVGWSTPILAAATSDTTYELSVAGLPGDVLRLPIADDEYFLLEYRESDGGDRGLPGRGVLVQHIVESRPLKPLLPTDPRVYRIALVEADDDSALIRIDAEGGDRGRLSDAFGYGVTTFETGVHSAARTASGDPLPFRLTEISFDPSRRKARVRVVRVP